MINNRPATLESLPFYKHLPKAPFTYDSSVLPVVLRLDVFDLCGLLPMTIDISNLCPEGIFVQPSDAVIEYYMQNNTKFQMILVVANFYDLKLENGVLIGKPYSISLVPASVDGKIDESDARIANALPLENMQRSGFMYLDFDPFTPGYSMFTNYNGFICETGLDIYTDSIGFVINTYFLATSYKKEDILLADMPDAPKFIRDRYRQFRINHYFKPFTNIMPRKIWGMDSPIELFLAQAMAARGIYPQMQNLIFKSGDIFPSFFDMITPETASNNENSDLLTAVDFYFPNKKVAVFCDSTRHHRSRRSKEKDQKISNALQELGIRSVRLDGSDIVKSLDKTVDTVAKYAL